MSKIVRVSNLRLIFQKEKEKKKRKLALEKSENIPLNPADKFSSTSFQESDAKDRFRKGIRKKDQHVCHFLYGFLISFFLEANDRTYKPIRSLDTRPKSVRGIVLWLFLNTFPCTTWRLFIFPLKVVAFLPQAPSTSVISILFSPPSRSPSSPSLKFKVIEPVRVFTPHVIIYRFAGFRSKGESLSNSIETPWDVSSIWIRSLHWLWCHGVRIKPDKSQPSLCGHCYFANRDATITNCDERMVYRFLRYLAPFPLHRYLEMFQRKQWSNGKITAWNRNDGEATCRWNIK